ncbi:MAG: hypothetical protein PSX36_14775 [bacterium]|nr:hypothetical protein [bacterium]
MKTITKLILSLILTFVLLGFESNAQTTCPLSFSNLLNCQVTLKYTVYDASCVILRTGTLTIPASNRALIGGACCATAYDIAIDVYDIGGATTSTAETSASTFWTGSSTLSGSDGAPCGVSYSINVNAGGGTIQ